MFRMESSTNCVSMLSVGRWMARCAIGVTATRLVAASTAPAMTYGREARCMTRSPLGIELAELLLKSNSESLSCRQSKGSS